MPPKRDNEISVYTDKNATIEEVVVGLSRLKKAFPKMSINKQGDNDNSFFDLLSERLIENNFSGQRLKDAINHVIDNFQYKELTVADIIKFDRKVKLYTYTQAYALIEKGLCNWGDFKIIEMSGKSFRVMEKDLL